jgi:hypothetical protein
MKIHQNIVNLKESGRDILSTIQDHMDGNTATVAVMALVELSVLGIIGYCIIASLPQ